MKFLFVTGGTPATVFALSPLASAARNAGHEVFMASIADMAPVISALGLPAVPATPLPLGHFIAKDRSGNPVGKPEGPMGEMANAGRWFARMAAASLPALRELASAWRPDVVVGGTMAYAAPLLAAHLKVPFVRQAWDIMDASPLLPFAAEELRPELDELGLGELPEPDVFVDICPPGLRGGQGGAGQPMRWIPGNAQRPLEPWMYTPGRRRRICVTHGTRVGLSHVQARDILSTLVRKVAVLDAEIVVAAPDDIAAELRTELRAELGPDVWAGWVPLDVVAPTCDLVVHHGGGVTGLTALNAGTPQLLLPRGPAFMPAAQRMAASGAALAIPPGQDGAEAVTQACRRLLDEPSYRARARALSREIAGMPLPGEVVGLLEKLGAK